MKQRHRSGVNDEVVHTDDWPPGLVYRHCAKSARKVTRAKGDFYAVIPVLLQHNLRIGNEKHRHKRPIDPARTHLNTVLVGPASPDEGARQARQEFDALGIVPSRWDNIPAIEIVTQPPDEWDRDEFWNECLTWARREFSHVLSVVVHRDQVRPHMHVIVLAITDGELAGGALTNGDNSLPLRQRRFMAHMRATLGLRPDRSPSKPKKSMTATFTSTGKGPRRHEEAERKDAEFVRSTSKNWRAKRLAGKEVESNLLCTTSNCARLKALSKLFAGGVESGAFASSPDRPLEPAPMPMQHCTPVLAFNIPAGLLAMLTTPTALAADLEPALCTSLLRGRRAHVEDAAH